MRSRLILFLLFFSACGTGPKADWVLRNGAIYTLDSKERRAQSLAVGGGTILYVGDDAGVEAFVGPESRVSELGGKMALPGFIDSHSHPSGALIQAVPVSLYDLRSLEQYLEAVRRFAEENPDKQAVRGSGWSNALFPVTGPMKEDLDAVVSDRPVQLGSGGGHSSWGNSKGLELAGIPRDPPGPEGGVIERDPSTGEATGTLRESATGLVAAVLPPFTMEERMAGLLAFQEMAAKDGVTTARVAAIGLSAAGDLDPSEVVAYERLESEGKLRVRFRGSLLLPPPPPRGRGRARSRSRRVPVRAGEKRSEGRAAPSDAPPARHAFGRETLRLPGDHRRAPAVLVQQGRFLRRHRGPVPGRRARFPGVPDEALLRCRGHRGLRQRFSGDHSLQPRRRNEDGNHPIVRPRESGNGSRPRGAGEPRPDDRELHQERRLRRQAGGPAWLARGGESGRRRGARSEPLRGPDGPGGRGGGSLDRHHRSEALARRADAFEFHQDSCSRGLGLVVEQLGGAVDVGDEKIDPAVVVVVPGGEPPARAPRRHPGVEREGSRAVVSEHLVRLGIGSLRRHPIHLGIDVAVGDVQIEVGVGVEVDESDTPGEREVGGFADAPLVGGIGEKNPPEALVEGRVIVGKGRHDEVGVGVEVDIRGVDPHSRLFPAVAAVGGAAQQTLFGERSVASVAEQVMSPSVFRSQNI